MNDDNRKDWTKAEMARIPSCDFCYADACYDGKTTAGPWAYMCETHWEKYGLGRIGLGFGQRLVKI